MLAAAVGQMRVMRLQESHQAKAVGTAAAPVHSRVQPEQAAAEVALPIFAYVQMHQFQIYVR
jgi:hypothetical protein